MSLQEIFATRANRMKASEIRELLKLLDQPDIISFAGGIPDPDLFPKTAFQDAFAEALNGPMAAQGLQYSTSEGHKPLRVWIAAQMQAIGIPATPDNILITSGSQQAPRWWAGRPTWGPWAPLTPTSRATTSWTR